MRSGSVFLAAGSLLLLLYSPVYAQGGQLSAIYLVDMQKAIDGSDIGKTAKSRMDAEIKKQEQELEKKKAEIDRTKADLIKQSSLLSAEAAEEKRVQLEQKNRELQRSVDDARQNLTRKNGAEIEKVVREIDLAVKELSREGGYQVVLERDPRFVLYASERYDLTDEVVKRLNEKDLKLD